MDIAIICIGIPHKNLEVQKSLLKTHEEIFPDCDKYYYTWTDYIKRVPVEYQELLMTCEEPKINYHPFIDTPYEPNVNQRYINARKAAENEFRADPSTAAAKKRHGHLQILGYADAFSRVDKKYDMYIKIRWDLLLHPEADFKNFFKVAMEEGPVGFAQSGGGSEAVLPLIVQPKELNIKLADRWECYIADQMIFHSDKHFDPQLVSKLHNEKKLHPIEWGWWQVMSHPYGGDIHTCVWNGVKIKR